MNDPECPFIEPCPIFKHFRRSAKKVYISTYCQGEYKTCRRYLLKQSGQTVPENLLPHGGTLWEDEPPPGARA
ncbi:MAG: hypothetical protein JW910_01760 [Anaerolineae bacterium]|nr:hypothetical protein [Anaerolineae bacterium]